MLKRITVCFFSIIILIIAIIPCFAQELNSDEIVSTESVSVSSDIDNDEVVPIEAVTDSEIKDESVKDKKTVSNNIKESKDDRVASAILGIPSVEDTQKEKEASKIEIAERQAAEKNETFVDKIKNSFYKTFIKEDRWEMYLTGFGNTVIIAIFSTLLGVLIGLIVAVVKVLHVQIDKPNVAISFLNWFFNLYTTLIRGTPAIVQLFIAYYIIFKSSNNSTLVAILAFGVNSGAYVSEIVRGGIVSIDKGQLEAGRSLGLSYFSTMLHIILPQAIKNILPSLGNEFILLLKDTSIAGYVGIDELMKAGDVTISRTMDPYFPLLTVAVVYLICVIGLEQLFKYFERRMAKSDRH